MGELILILVVLMLLSEGLMNTLVGGLIVYLIFRWILAIAIVVLIVSAAVKVILAFFKWLWNIIGKY